MSREPIILGRPTSSNANGPDDDTALLYLDSNGNPVIKGDDRVVRALLVALDAAYSDAQGSADVVNSQPFCSRKISAWATGGGGSAPPLRGLMFGDSISTGFWPGPKMGNAGMIGLGLYAASGTVTPLGNRFDYWINGIVYEFAVGSTAQWTWQSQATGEIRGDKASIAYIRKPGGGSFDVQYAANGLGNATPSNDTGWTTLGTINTAHTSVAGAVQVYDLPTSASPFYRLRIKNVTTGAVVIVNTGIYNSNGGGVIWMPVAALAGIDLSSSVQTPPEVFDPIWSFLAPDFVLTAWADAADNWQTGGHFRTMYARATAAFPRTDWIVVSRNPGLDEIANPAAVEAQRIAQRDWCAENRHTWINGHSIFGGYLLARERGMMSRWNDLTNVSTTLGSPNITFNNYGSSPLANGALNVTGPGIPEGTTLTTTGPTSAVMSKAATATATGQTLALYDVIHLGTAGKVVRNNHMWSKLPLGYIDLGGIGVGAPGLTDNLPLINASACAGAADANPFDLLRSLEIRYSGGYIGIRDRNYLASWHQMFMMQNTDGDVYAGRGGATNLIIGGGARAGLFPGFDDEPLGGFNNGTNFWQGRFTTSKHKTYIKSQLDGMTSRGAGTRAFCSDASVTLTAGIGTILAGGGVNTVPVYYDGTNWRIG